MKTPCFLGETRTLGTNGVHQTEERELGKKWQSSPRGGEFFNCQTLKMGRKFNIRDLTLGIVPILLSLQRAVFRRCIRFLLRHR